MLNNLRVKNKTQYKSQRLCKSLVLLETRSLMSRKEQVSKENNKKNEPIVKFFSIYNIFGK